MSEGRIKYVKYHALGNDYLVLDPVDIPADLSQEMVRLICHRNYGIGSDGILLGPLDSKPCDFGLRILNPDGSEAEKSGNGLRIFARYLWDRDLVGGRPFTLETPGGTVLCEVDSAGRSVRVEMGEVSFMSNKIPVNGPYREVLKEEIRVCDRIFKFCGATVGNPHCVILSDRPTEDEAKRYGPHIEVEPRFPNRTNVQFMGIIDRSNIRIEIWERGAGYTLASGSSSTAAAAVAHKLDLCDSVITVHMPGGELQIMFHAGFFATMTGPVTKVCEGVMLEEMFEKDPIKTSK